MLQRQAAWPVPERAKRRTTSHSERGRAELQGREPRVLHGRVSSTSWSNSCPYCLRCGLLESRRVGLAGADAYGVIHTEDKDFAVADLSGFRSPGDGADDFVDLVSCHCHLHLEFGEEAHRILGPTVDFRVTLLTPVSFDLGNSQPLHADGGQGVTDLVELERFNNGHDDFHGFDPRLSPFLRSHSAGGTLSRADKARFEGMAGEIESNAVPVARGGGYLADSINEIRW